MMNATTDNGGASARSNPSARSAAELEREGEEIRADLDRTLDEIERKLSPGELLDRSVEFLRDNGSDFLKEAGETVRRNPIPVLLTAAGLVWLTTSVARSRSRSDSESDDFSGGDYASRGYSRQEYYTGPEGRGEQGVRGRVRSAASKVTSKASRATSTVKGKLSNSMHAVQDRTQDARSNFVNLVQEQPVALGALALAAGALLGAAFPITPYENRLVGPVHDRTMARAKELGQQQYQNIRDAVTSSLSQKEESGNSRPSSSQTASSQGANQPPEQG
jgi:ElaB/YqjD/DUF883 family membrane-anchored ribosome-binding protein